MFNPFEVPNLRYVGEYSHPQVNHGQPLPMFEPVAPEGRPSINTLDGWIKYADEGNRREFISANNREPINKEELHTWVDQICRKIEVAV